MTHEEIGARWALVRERIDAALSRAGRSADTLKIIAVTKTFPASDVQNLQRLGFTEFGENRVAELAQKAAYPYERSARWHMLGQLQTNKVNQAVRAAEVIHSCDRPRLVNALERAAENIGKCVEVLIQVRLDDDPRRGGVAPASVLELAEQIASSNALRLRGVMAMAPKNEEPARGFSRLQEVSQQLALVYPDANWVSAGMSNDFETAIEFGATHIRLGRGLLGSRPQVG